MKKIIMTLAAALCCAMTTIVFTACGDDDDENNTPDTKEIKGIAARYLFSVDEQMAQLCDYTMTYYGINGELTTEQATWTTKDGTATWMKDVSSTQLPATFGLKVSVKVKEDAQLEGVRISNIFPFSKLLYVEGITTKAEKDWGKTVDFTSASNHANTTGEKLAAYIEAWERHGGVLNKTYTFDKDGNQVSSGSIE